MKNTKFEEMWKNWKRKEGKKDKKYYDNSSWFAKLFLDRGKIFSSEYDEAEKEGIAKYFYKVGYATGEEKAADKIAKSLYGKNLDELKENQGGK